MADALGVATYLNIFLRNSSWVQMANLAQMVNAIAPIVTSPRRRRRAADLLSRDAPRYQRTFPGGRYLR